MGRITVIGTGWAEKQLTFEAAEALQSGGRVILHTSRCGVTAWLEQRNIAWESLDCLYEECEDFDAHVEAAVHKLVEAAAAGDIVYGVFDIRDRTVPALLRAMPDCKIIAGPPIEGALLACAEGETRAVEASDWENFHLSARESCVVRELDSRELAAEVKLKLMSVYPEESEVWLLNARTAPEKTPLYALDRAERYDHRTCALIPACRDILGLERYDFEHLVDIIRFLCSPGGCPWDRVQTHETLRPYILEEAYEVIDAIDAGDPEHLYDELGDMLLQIVLHAEIARKHGSFDISDVTTAICEKMISRHSHIFGGDHAGDADEVIGLWTRNKMAERGQQTRTEVMRSVTRALPALLRAAKVLKRCSEVGLADADVAEAASRASKAACALPSAANAETAVGDALLSLVAAARCLNVDPEIALNGAVDRLIDRFDSVEQRILSEGGAFERLSPETLRD